MFLLVFILSVLIASCSQVLLKKSANKCYSSIWKEYLNPHVVVGYGFFFISTLLAIWGYKGLPLKIGPVLESLGYVFIIVLSFFFFKVKPKWNTLVGTAFIIAGIVLFRI